MEPTPGREVDLSSIASLVRRTRRLLRVSWVLTGAALTAGLAIGTLLVMSLVDYLVPLHTVLRFAACLLVVVPTMSALLIGVAAPTMRRLSINWVARRIEKQIPKIQNRLVTTLDIDRNDDLRDRSPAFFRRLVEETIERTRPFRPASIVDRRSLRQATSLATVTIAAFLAGYLWCGDWLPTAMARVLQPWADIPPASSVGIRPMPGNATVLKGDDLTIAAEITRGSAEAMELQFRKPDGKTLRYTMTRTKPDRFEFTIQALSDPIDYRIVGGGTWTVRHRIDVVERPAITGIQTMLHYPEYMKIGEPKVGPPQTGDVAGPVSSTVEVRIDAAGSVATGEIQLLEPVTRMKAVKDRRERVWFEAALPDGARAEGQWHWDHALKFRAAHTEPASAGHTRHAFHSTPVAFELLPNDVLFTYVFLAPGTPPEEIMMEWHDGSGWEHRAYWGEDRIQLGAVGTPARVHLGPMPKPGEWVRLEVPAARVGLAGRKIHGWAFGLFKGQAKWNRAGVIDPAEIPERDFIVSNRFPMRPAAAVPSAAATKPAGPADAAPPAESPTTTTQWVGRIPLDHDGMYRVELKNELGYANREAKENKLTAIPDMPPQVVLERPGQDLVLSEPGKVPLVVRAYDDFGLADVSLAVQKGDSGGFIGQPIRTYDQPARNDTVVSALDLAPHQLKVGEHVRYRVEVRDRKGQTAQTQEYVVRIAADANAADKQIAALEKQQDTFQEKLLQLIAAQSKVTEALSKAAGREPPEPAQAPVKDGQTKDTADAAKQAAAPKPQPAGAESTQPAAKAPAADTTQPAMLEKQLAELRQQLAQLIGQQDANVQTATQLDAELQRAAAAAEQSRLMPTQLAQQFKAAEQAFQNMAVEPMKQLGQAMRHAAAPQPNQPAPTPNALADQAEQVQRQLEAMRDRMEALAKAQDRMREDPAEALAELRKDLMAQNAALTEQELREFQQMLDALLGQMKLLEGQQAELARQTPEAMPALLPHIAKKQEGLEAEAQPVLAQAEDLMEADMLAEARRRRDPMFPDAPHQPAGEEMLVPPAEADTPEEAAADRKAQADAKSKADAMQEEEEEMFMPALGARLKTDPRFASKQRPVAKKPGAAKDKAVAKNSPHGKQAMPDPKTALAPPAESGESPPMGMRAELSARQQAMLQALQRAQQQLQPSREQLAQLLEQLREAMGLTPEQARQLGQLMQSAELQNALQMAQAMRQPPQPGQPQQAQAQQNSAQMLQSLLQSASLNPNPGARPGRVHEFQSNDIDLTAETVLLRMQPRLREELLRGRGDQRPKGYDQFIEDYYNRLTRTKGPQ
jgi:hypothetical protein